MPAPLRLEYVRPCAGIIQIQVQPVGGNRTGRPLSSKLPANKINYTKKYNTQHAPCAKQPQTLYLRLILRPCLCQELLKNYASDLETQQQQIKFIMICR